jgi:hypothetical protein
MYAYAVWIAVGVFGLVLLVVGIRLVVRARSRERPRTVALRGVFGSEYARTVAGHGGRARGEQELRERLHRRREVVLRDVSPDQRDRYEAAWEAARAMFVETPDASLRAVDRLLAQVMEDRGYPAGRFEEVARLVSTDHPELVEYVRAAHRVTVLARESGAADTEQMRQAMVVYREMLDALFDGASEAHVRRV